MAKFSRCYYPMEFATKWVSAPKTMFGALAKCLQGNDGFWWPSPNAWDLGSTNAL